MTLSETVHSVDAFFESYRTAFERLDAPAIADHFAYPSHITGEAGEIVLVSVPGRQEWIGKIEQLLAGYRAIGFGSARVLDLAPTELSPRLVQAMVHWALYDGAGRMLYDFQAAYTLVKIDDMLRISAIAHNPAKSRVPRTTQKLTLRSDLAGCARECRSAGLAHENPRPRGPDLTCFLRSCATTASAARSSWG